MKIINNSAVEFFSTFCPSFYEKKNKKKKTRETIERRSRFSECRRHEWGGGGGGTRGGWPLLLGVCEEAPRKLSNSICQ